MPADGSPTIDQLRTFVAVVDAGGFSGAAKRLGRSQPAVSYAMAALEEQLGLALFKRGRRSPVLTDAGAAILAYARRICLLGDELQASASNLTGGLEGVVSIAIDSFFPRARLTAAMKDFAANFPSATPHLFVGSRDAVLERVLDRESVIGISATDIAWPSGIEARDFGAVTIVAVAAPTHALSQHRGEIPASLVRDNIQITNKPPGKADEKRDIAVNSARLWRVNDLATAVAVLSAGVGWGYLPLHVAEPEFAAGRLVRLRFSTRSQGEQAFALIYRADSPPGPAARWLAKHLMADA
jgi:DNA-binding transcriptional LysR family regulator